MLSPKLLENDTKKILYRSAVRPSDSAHPNKRLVPDGGESSQNPKPIVFSDQSTYFIEYSMQDNFKYPRIKKIYQVLKKITRIDQKVKILCVLKSHELLSTKYTTHQFRYFMYCSSQDKFKNSRIIKMHHVHQKLQAKQLYYFV